MEESARANKRREVSAIVGSIYSTGEGKDMTRVTYLGEVGALINWDGDAAGTGGEGEGLGCSRAEVGLG